MAKKRWKRKQRAPRVMIWHTSRRTGMALIWGRDLVRLTPGDARLLAEKLEHAALEVDPDWDPDTEVTLPDSLESQLSSEVEAAMDQGPAAPPSSSVPLGGTARLAEELGSARETLAEILASSHHAPRDERDARPTQIKQAFEGPVTGFTSPPRPHYETLMLGLAEHPTDPGKILINGKPLSLGHARNYGIAMHRIIEAQQAKAFGRDLQATVATPEPPAEIPTLRAD